MIDPILSLAMSMHANPGVYAILVGSGVSRSTKIPTGWEIVLDLARKLALMHKEECEPDPAAWYHSKFGKDPHYAELLDAIGRTPAERQQLLRSYFEPTDEEREQGFKRPTAAHRAIARLVSDGHCRVVLTTNFDKLIERAIEDEGISPVVLSTSDAIGGALPLVHQRCCVVKLHGDYLDTRIRNTPAELAVYDDQPNRFLDEIFDNFGLIICGWSGKWDAALRAAIERCRSRRFSYYWAARGTLSEYADRLLKQRAGEVIAIEDADSFFDRLAGLVTALKDSKRQHPTSVEAAVALTKRYLADPRYRIQLEDLATDERELAFRQIEAYSEKVVNTQTPVAIVFQTYREILERLQAIIMNGAAYGGSDQHLLWISILQRISRNEKQSGTHLRDGIRQYPTAVLLYSAGIVAISRGKFELLNKLFVEPTMRARSESVPMLTELDYPGMNEFAKTIAEHQRHHVPLSEHLFAVLRSPLSRFIPDAEEYEDVFDRFEFLRALVYAHTTRPMMGEKDDCWVPVGRYCWKADERYGESIITRFKNELTRSAEQWPPLKAGMFNGAVDRAQALIGGVERFVASLRMW